MGFKPIQSSNTMFVPTISTPAGSTLTAANWQDSGVQMISCALESLLMKPGYDVLMKLDNLASYLGWDGPVVLDASLPFNRKENLFKHRSLYDGQILRHTNEQIMALIASLKPTHVILPESFSDFKSVRESLPENRQVFGSLTGFFENNAANNDGYIYKILHTDQLETSLNLDDTRPSYISGAFEPGHIGVLTRLGATYIESDKPADDGLHGRVYTPSGTIVISDPVFEKAFDRLDAGCECPTCAAQFTRAYLHHLFSQTPLLCQRLLIQHNIYYLMTIIKTGNR